MRSFFSLHQFLVRSRLGVPVVDAVHRAYEPVGMYQYQLLVATDAITLASGCPARAGIVASPRCF
jgi:hypothetical protein